ncbi:SapC family protein [Paraferrimonas sedimenticola]|uniref:Peptidase n=1 Tax=Paraferrimonas sedimenticola TaxID=375674 RepID=A0AA37RTM2_9GAMM|nr:SapC family protein [Paraferrimonas sedimenticola]GLP95074.1 peptidase [Paraferrimonas sedimenticola]
MALELVPLTKQQHAKTKLLPNPGFKHVKDEHIAPVLVQEFSRASSEFPIVFVKRNEEELQPVVILGLKPGENLYTDGQRWTGLYIPASVTHHPFALVPSSQNEDELMVAILQGSDLLSEEEGQPLFDDKGEATELLERRKDAMLQQFEMANVTRAFTKTIQELDLFEAQSLNLELNGEKVTINGLHMVNEKKLMDLPAKKVEDLNKRGLLGPIYAHLSSLHQIHRVATKRAELKPAEAPQTEAAEA